MTSSMLFASQNFKISLFVSEQAFSTDVFKQQDKVFVSNERFVFQNLL